MTLPGVEDDTLISLLFEMGTVKSTGFGAAPLDWVDIKAYTDLMGIELRPNEVKLLRRLSSEYAAQVEKSKNPATIAPFVDDNERQASLDLLFSSL